MPHDGIAENHIISPQAGKISVSKSGNVNITITQNWVIEIFAKSEIEYNWIHELFQGSLFNGLSIFDVHQNGGTYLLSYRKLKRSIKI